MKATEIIKIRKRIMNMKVSDFIKMKIKTEQSLQLAI